MNTQVYGYVTDAIIKALENGKIPWRKPWKANGISQMNYKSKKPYRGINSLLTALSEFGSPYWLTYKQATELGGQVKKGEKGTMVVFYKTMQYQDKNNPESTKNIPLLRYYNIFNLEQIDGIEVPVIKTDEKKFNPIDTAENLINYMKDRPTISYGGDRACYSPMRDSILLPTKESFFSNEEYYSTAFHELAHATGHSSRLNRFANETATHMFGSESYSKEELIAEITATFMCNHCDIKQTFDNSIAYIQSWLKILQSDNKFVIQAANAGQKAADYIINNNLKNGSISNNEEDTNE